MDVTGNPVRVGMLWLPDRHVGRIHRGRNTRQQIAKALKGAVRQVSQTGVQHLINPYMVRLQIAEPDVGAHDPVVRQCGRPIARLAGR